MSSNEREQLKVLARVKRGELNLKEAAELLAVSYRQSRRLYKRHQELGDRGLLHRSRGRPSNRGHQMTFKQTVLGSLSGVLPGLWSHAGGGKASRRWL